MKRNDFNEIKRLDTKALLEKARVLRGELSDLILDKNMSKLADLKAISKKRKDIAQILTVVKQKQLLEQFELADGEPKVAKEPEESKVKAKKGEK
jgi:ribosomal protein L29